MGGTEMEAALRRAFSLKGAIEEHNVLLITDGEVWNHEAAAQEARDTRHRIFTIGVGSAVAEAVVRQLSESTGGACELAAPREDMAGVILRQFARIYQPHAHWVRIVWPAQPLWQTPEAIPTVFNGDTVHVMARFAAVVSGEVTVEMALADGSLVRQSVKLGMAEAGEAPAPAAARLAAACRIKDMDRAGAVALALQYQLMSPYTACLVLAERADKAQDLPELRAVPQMLAAGWGGIGSVAGAYDALDAPGVVYSMARSSVDIPAFLRKSRDEPRSPDEPRFVFSRSGHSAVSDGDTPRNFVAGLNTYFKGPLRRTPCPRTALELTAFGLPDEIMETLSALLGAGWAEELVVVGFLNAFGQKSRDGSLSRNALRTIRKAAKSITIAAQLADTFKLCLAAMTENEWNWHEPTAFPIPANDRAR